MKLKKVLMAGAMIGALSVACATASLAADNFTATYADGNMTITGYGDYATAVGTGDFTLLVLDQNATTVTDTMIKQIDQDGATKYYVDSVATATVPVGTLADGTYYVRLGGLEATTENTKGFLQGTMTVGSTSPYDNPNHLVGDVNSSDTIDAGDLTDLVKHSAGTAVLTGDNFQAADVNDSGTVDAGDITDFVKYNAGTGSLACETLGDKTNLVEVAE